MSKLPTIPDFTLQPPSMGAAVRTLKLAVEILGGMGRGESLGSPLIYVQGNPPGRGQPATLRAGDLWIDTDIDTLNYWNGNAWRKVAL